MSWLSKAFHQVTDTAKSVVNPTAVDTGTDAAAATDLVGLGVALASILRLRGKQHSHPQQQPPSDNSYLDEIRKDPNITIIDAKHSKKPSVNWIPPRLGTPDGLQTDINGFPIVPSEPNLGYENRISYPKANYIIEPPRSLSGSPGGPIGSPGGGHGDHGSPGLLDYIQSFYNSTMQSFYNSMIMHYIQRGFPDYAQYLQGTLKTLGGGPGDHGSLGGLGDHGGPGDHGDHGSPGVKIEQIQRTQITIGSPDGPGGLDCPDGPDGLIVDNRPLLPNTAKADIWGDPHLVGFKGQKFDVHGEADGKDNFYNLLSDATGSGINVNAKFALSRPGVTSASQIGILAGRTKIQHNNSQVPTIDGVQMKPGEEKELPSGDRVRWDGKTLITNTPEYELHSYTEGSTVRLKTKSTKIGVDNRSMPGGLLGVTADDQEPQGVIDGTHKDYKEQDLFVTRSKYNRLSARSYFDEIISLIQKLGSSLSKFFTTQPARS